MAPLSRPLLALVAVLATFQNSLGFQPSRTNALFRRNEYTRTLSVASQDTATETETTKDVVPYSISRGDGSTGGGGLSMPNAVEDELKRPKVGAEMPHGRPSWFRVPAPSQGKPMVWCLSTRGVLECTISHETNQTKPNQTTPHHSRQSCHVTSRHYSTVTQHLILATPR
jgi:hypothetical protein